VQRTLTTASSPLCWTRKICYSKTRFFTAPAAGSCSNRAMALWAGSALALPCVTIWVAAQVAVGELPRHGGRCRFRPATAMVRGQSLGGVSSPRSFCGRKLIAATMNDDGIRDASKLSGTEERCLLIWLATPAADAAPSTHPGVQLPGAPCLASLPSPAGPLVRLALHAHASQVPLCPLQQQRHARQAWRGQAWPVPLHRRSQCPT